MTAPATHVHITEREPDGSWEDCTWASGLEFYRDAFDPSRPATHAEFQALRAASGEPLTGGSNIGNLKAGIKARYGKVLSAIPAHDILAALKPGYCAVVQGSMLAFGMGDPLSKWDTSFDGGHAVYIARDPSGVLLWCDPEAPAGAAVPVVISSTDVQKFVNAFAGEAIVAPALQWAKEANMAGVAYEFDSGAKVGKFTVVGGGHGYLNLATAAIDPLPAGSVHDAFGPVTLVGRGILGPADTRKVGYIIGKQAAFAISADGTFTPTAVAVDDGFTKATQDAAVLAQKAADQVVIDFATQRAIAAENAVAKATAGAATAERERLAQAEANRIRGL